MMHAVGITRLITVDLHADQIQGFFYMPVDNVYTTPIMVDDMIVDARCLPLDLQIEACNRGLIPYVPALEMA